MTTLKIEQVSRTFPARPRHGPTLALEPIDLNVGKNDFVTILGPSGCGKSTLLYIVGGFVTPTGGVARMKGKAITGPGPDRGPVFQEFALFHASGQFLGVEILEALETDHFDQRAALRFGFR